MLLVCTLTVLSASKQMWRSFYSFQAVPGYFHLSIGRCMGRCVQNEPVLTGPEAHVFIITYHFLIIVLTFTARIYQSNRRVQSKKH